MKLDIWIASHINCENRLTTLRYCIQSIFHQTIQPRQLIVSISTSIDINKVKDVLTSFTSTPNMEYKFYISADRLLQMQHIQRISNKIIGNNSNLNIMFCDDDDLNDSKRVENYLKYATFSLQVYCSKIIEFADSETITDKPENILQSNILPDNNRIDFGGLIVPFWKIKQWFTYNEPSNDVVFRKSLGNIIVIPESIYYVRIPSTNLNVNITRDYGFEKM